MDDFLLILNLWDISFHAVVVFGLGKELLFKSVLGRCAFHIHGTARAKLAVKNALLISNYVQSSCKKYSQYDE